MSFSLTFGNWLYHSGNRFEAALYGFKPAIIDAAGIPHNVWTNHRVDKPALLLVHGFSASHAVWLRFAKHFSRDYHVIIPDLAGHGETGFDPATNYAINQQSQRLCSVLDALGVKQAHIAGNSMGGFIAAHMARYHPSRCRSIVLIDPAGVVSPSPSAMETMLKQGRNPFFIDNDAEFDRFFHMTMAKPPYLPKITLRALSITYQGRKAELEKIFADYNKKESFLDTELEHIRCPSVIIWGAQDQLIHVSSVAVWQQLPNTHSIVWNDLGHMPMLEAPKRTAQAVRGFLNATE